MFKIFLTTATVFATFWAFSAKAENVYIPYLGADFTYGGAKSFGLKPNYAGALVNIGTKYNDYFGTEIFYQQTDSDTRHLSASKEFKTSYRAYGLDIYGYLPLGCEKTFELLGTAGFAEYVFRSTEKPQKHHTNTGYAYRIGAGALYHLTENTSLRAIARFADMHKVSYINNVKELTLGLRYEFK